MTNTLLLSTDTSGASPTPTSVPSKPRRVQGPFNKKDIAALDECEDVARAAQSAPYADILNSKYAITPANVTALLAKIAE